MIPILYYGNETSFTSNGVGRLSEIQECIVTEERNGIYEVEFTYPITGQYYKTMVSMVEAYSIGKFTQSGIIACIHDDRHDIQPFDIYAVSSPIDGIATFNAHHISYRLSGMLLQPFEATSCADAFTQIPLKIVGTNPFTFWTDKATGGSFKMEMYENVRSILGGEEGSILDVFGTGEYKFDKFEVRLYQHRGTNSGVTIRYGINLMDITREIDSSGHYNAIAPYWEGDVTIEGEETSESVHYVVTLPEHYIRTSALNGVEPVIAVVDFSQDFEELPTAAQLRARANEYLANNTPWIPEDNVKISFVQLWQTTEYANVALLQRLSLCDKVSIYYEDLGVIMEEQEVIKVVYNVLLERYDEMEVGNAQTSFSSSISAAIQADFEQELEKAKKDAITSSILQAAIAHATNLITGGLGGHVVMNLNADGEPQEILIMDTDDPLTAVNVIRMNQNGIGFSTNGYNGPFETAWTIDGAFNATFITSGTITANIIKGGTLSLGGANNGNGVMRLYDSNNKEICWLNNEGLTVVSTKWFSHYHTPTADGIDPSYTSNYMWPSLLSQYKDFWIRKTLFNNGGLKFYTRMVAENGALLGVPIDRYRGSILANGNGLEITFNEYFSDAEKRQGVCINGYGAKLAVGGYRWSQQGSRLFTDIDNKSINYVVAVDGDAFVVGPSGGGRICMPYSSGYGAYISHSYSGLAVELTSGQSTSQGTRRSETFTFEHLGNLNVPGGVSCSGMWVLTDKSKVVETEDYQKRLLYCYEMPSPAFGDIGDAILDENGEAYVFLEAIFAETIDTSHSYQVFLQKYGEGDCWVSDRKPDYFVVKGTPNLKFGWELKARQYDHSNKRLNKLDKDFVEPVVELSVDYGNTSADYIQELEEERMRVE